MDKIYEIIDPKNISFKYKEIDHPKYKYETTEHYYIKTDIHPDSFIETPYLSLGRGGVLQIRTGYRWDGASGPTIDTRNTMRASCVHDAIYQLIRCSVLSLVHKIGADRLLGLIMEEDWTPKTVFGRVWSKVRSGYYYWGVRLFGRWSCVPGSQKT